ncbi:MAG: hypothetical protein AAGC85_19690 [Bacteroidota bacterium]
MRKHILCLLAACTLSVGQAQTVNGTPLEEITSEHLDVRVMSQSFNRIRVVSIDYGEFVRPRDAILLDKNGREWEFSSNADVLNFFSVYGYQLISSYSENEGYPIHFVLQKK